MSATRSQVPSPSQASGAPAAAAVIDALRWRVAIDDAAFDRLYPGQVRRLSPMHWTPVSVALRAAALLAPEPDTHVLDIGAGAGKLCCIGALACGGRWHGIERNASLVAAATGVAQRLGVAHCTSFDTGDMQGVDWDRFDSLYFYNPFESVLFGFGCPDRDGWAAFADHVARAEERLSALSAGTRVVTFHGFGGEMPSGFALAYSEAIGEGQLALWIKQPRVRLARSRRGAL